MFELVLGIVFGFGLCRLFIIWRSEDSAEKSTSSKKKEKIVPRLKPGFSKTFYCPKTFMAVSAHTEEYSDGPCYYCGTDYIRGHQHYHSFSYRVWTDGVIGIRVPVWVVNSNKNVDWSKLLAYDVKKLVDSGTKEKDLRTLFYSEEDFPPEEFIPVGESTNVEI